MKGLYPTIEGWLDTRFECIIFSKDVFIEKSFVSQPPGVKRVKRMIGNYCTKVDGILSIEVICKISLS